MFLNFLDKIACTAHIYIAILVVRTKHNIYRIVYISRSGTKMNAQETYITLAAIQGELQSTTSELFGMFCIEHKDNGGSRNARTAFANILKKTDTGNSNNKEFDNILETMNYGFVKNRIYDTNGEGEMVLREEINLKILDSLFLYDCLKNIKGFPTFQEKLQRRRRLKSCKQALHQQCCLACNHKCAVCEKKECKDDKCHPGSKCNQHPCRNCDETKEVCLIFSSVCCKKCGTCFYCGSKLKLDITDRCNRLRLVCGLDILYKFRILFEKLTFEDCDLLIKGLHTLPGFPLCRSLGELGDYLLDAHNEVLSYLMKQENFTKQQVLPAKDVEHKLNTMSEIFKNDDADWLLFTQQDDVIKTLGFVNEACKEPSKEYDSVMKRIEELKSDERFQRHRCSVLVETRKPSNAKDVNANLKDMAASTTTVSTTIVEDGKVEDERTILQEHHQDEADNKDRVKKIETVPQVVKDDEEQETPDGGNQFQEDVSEETPSSKNDPETTLTTNKDTTRCIHQSIDSSPASTHQNVDLSLLQDSVHEIKQSMKTFHNQFEEKLHTSQFEQLGSISALEEANEKVLSQLTAVMDKLIAMDTERKEERMKNDQNIEEIKRNQKNILETLEAMQKAKGTYLK